MRSTSLLQSSLFLLFVVFSLVLAALVDQVLGRQIDNNKYDGSNSVSATETRSTEAAAALTWYARRPRHPSPPTKKRTKKRGIIIAHHDPEVVRIVGSRLPDCSHACGPCSPCRLVTISFVCSSLEEAESCPMAYKCMCNSKSYPVP